MPAHLRLCDDPYARTFLRSRGYRFLCSSTAVSRVAHRLFDRGYGGINIQHHLRNRYYESRLERAVADGVRQIIMVGAGYDSLALRYAFDGAVVFEVDAPPTQASKREMLEKAGLTPNATVEYVPCDFQTDELSTSLREHGLDTSRPSFAVFMGVSYYLTEAAVRATVRELSTVMVEGSELVFDYMDRSVIDGSTKCAGARRAAASVAKRGEPYTFGVGPDDLERLAAETGFEVIEILSVARLVERHAPPEGVWCKADDFMGVAAFRRPG